MEETRNQRKKDIALEEESKKMFNQKKKDNLRRQRERERKRERQYAAASRVIAECATILFFGGTHSH